MVDKLSTETFQTIWGVFLMPELMNQVLQRKAEMTN